MNATKLRIERVSVTVYEQARRLHWWESPHVEPGHTREGDIRSNTLDWLELVCAGWGQTARGTLEIDIIEEHRSGRFDGWKNFSWRLKRPHVALCAVGRNTDGTECLRFETRDGVGWTAYFTGMHSGGVTFSNPVTTRANLDGYLYVCSTRLTQALREAGFD